MSDTSQRLAYLIKDLGVSNNSFAASVGISKSSISRILSGEIEPTVKTIKKITEATKVSPNWLLGYGKINVIEKIE